MSSTPAPLLDFSSIDRDSTTTQKLHVYKHVLSTPCDLSSIAPKTVTRISAYGSDITKTYYNISKKTIVPIAEFSKQLTDELREEFPDYKLYHFLEQVEIWNTDLTALEFISANISVDNVAQKVYLRLLLC